jgi:hypothetical protein
MEPLRLAYTGGLADARHNASKESGGKNIRRWPGADENKKGGRRRRRGKNEWLADGMRLERTAKRLEIGCLGHRSLWLHRRHAVTVLQGRVVIEQKVLSRRDSSKRRPAVNRPATSSCIPSTNLETTDSLRLTPPVTFVLILHRTSESDLPIIRCAKNIAAPQFPLVRTQHMTSSRTR